MPNARQTSLIASPSSSRATNRRRSSITEHSFHGLDPSPGKGKGVTHVSGTICHLCLGPLNVATVLDNDRRKVGPPIARGTVCNTGARACLQFSFRDQKQQGLAAQTVIGGL